MFSLKKTALCLLMIAPVSSFAASNYCIAVNGGFGTGGTTFVGSGFTLPAQGTCNHWSGFTKTNTSVIMTTSGTGCLSSDAKILTVGVFSADPNWLGAGQVQHDYIHLCPAGIKSCPIGGGTDVGNYGGAAQAVNCTSNVLSLPAMYD